MADDQKNTVVGPSWPEILAGATRSAPKWPHWTELAFGSWGQVVGGGTTRVQPKGHSKKKVTDPCVYLINFRGTDQPQNIIFFTFFFSTFLGVSRGGEFKNTIKNKCKKSMSKTFSKKILRKSTKFSMSLFTRLFLFYRVFRCFLAIGVHKHYKKRFTKKSCRKVFTKNRQKNRQKNPQPIVSRKQIITFLGVSR
jgi:hypothetical protein